MATKTTNYNLTKPDYNDNADIGVINDNMDIIDTKMKEIEDAGGGTTITIDNELSTTSENPVQNKVVTKALNCVRKEVKTFTSISTIKPNESISLDVSDVTFNYIEISYYSSWNGVRNTVLLPNANCNFFVPVSASENGYASMSISNGNLVITNKISINIVVYRVTLFNL